MNTFKNPLATAVAATTACFICTGAIAQSQQSGRVLEEVIVTSQKRDATMQDTAISGAVVGGDELKNKGVVRLDDLTRVSPALSITDNGLSQNINIRGIGLSITSPAVNNGVATYYDGLFQPPIVTRNSFFDIESVEVLRGPQGTFVGSNSTGGAVFINSKNPSFDSMHGYVEAKAGNYSEWGLEGALNLPMTDTLAVRGAVLTNNRDAFFEDLGPFDNEPTSNDELAFRASILYQPTDNLEILSKTEKVDKELGGYAYKPIQGTVERDYTPDDTWDLDYNTGTARDEETLHTSLKVEYTFGGGTMLRSLTGYQNKEVLNLIDRDGTGEAAALAGIRQEDQVQPIRERIYSQEINLISPQENDLSWILGGYYQQNKIDVGITTNRNGALRTDLDLYSEKLTTGIFGQVVYRFNDEWSVDVGARTSSYEAEDDGSIFLAFVPVELDITADHDDGSEPTGKFNVSWTPNQDTLIYAFVAKGYKSGGLDDGQTFKPETVIDYEVGYKGAFLDNKVQAQFSAFYYDYSDFQFEVTDPFTGQEVVTNTAGATVMGVEAQVQAILGNWYFDMGFAYVDSESDGIEFFDIRAFDIDGASDPSDYIISTDGGPLLYAPELTFNISAEYRLDLSNGLSVTPRVNYAYTDEQWAYLAYNERFDLLEDRSLLSAQVSIEKGRYAAEFYATNLTDEEYVSGQTRNMEFYGAPRQYGVRVSMDF
ncbi:TonB-dependent receptor plug domain-containing protein [Parahaliea maris]|uniref:TonB-dependent receptor plug domain-containing protein n=1 Tax=Parahaliea maris TaxID=2716870 RepID=A0A5C8ZP04_9GAMM|nr:TonB-dependent receptor [Parahaliea maris]TXS90246.1 TonB-dependent receptor plug domain-containing protein [Parahaliea maris]